MIKRKQEAEELHQRLQDELDKTTPLPSRSGSSWAVKRIDSSVPRPSSSTVALPTLSK